MNDDSNRAAGLEPADTGGDADHPTGLRSRALAHLEAAQDSLWYLNRQEAQTAREHVVKACELIRQLAEVEEITLGEG